MSAVTVSVITPCYRQARFLAAAIDSVLAQTYPAVEMVVVNDGSDDGTDAVAAQYGPRIRYLEQTNGGQSSARNLGLEHARGEFVLFLDADDLLHPDALGWLVAAAREKAKPLCVMGCRAFQDDPAKAEEEWLPPALPALLPWFIGKNCGPPNCFLTRTAMVREVGGFDEKLAGCEDWDLWLKLALGGAELVPVPQVGAYYRRHGASFSSGTMRMLADRVRVLLRLHRRFLDNPGLLNAERAAELLETETRVRRRCLAQGAEPDHVAALTEAIAELHRSGRVAQKSWLRRLAEATVGEVAAERLALGVFRRFAPRRFAEYQQGFM